MRVIYTADVVRDNDSGAYVADIVEYKEAITHAETKEELLNNLQEALESIIIDSIAHGEPLRSPIDNAEEMVEGMAMLIPIDIDKVMHEANPKYDRRNITLPAYLNDYAKKEKIDVSKLAREALERELITH